MVTRSLSLLLISLTFARGNLVPKRFTALPLGQVRPNGWLKDQVQVQTNGLAGHLHEFYELVSKTDWIGGTSYYSVLEEAGSYWFNAMVPNAVLANDATILRKTEEFLDYVLEHQEIGGWIGPEVKTEKPRLLWGRYPFFFGAIQMTEYNASYTTSVVDALHNFIPLANKMLRNDGEGVDKWAATRWEDFVVILQWLYDYHPRGREDLLLDTMRRLKWTGVPWEDVFSPKYFPKGPVENLTNPFGLELSWHGVNMAEGLKALPATYRFTGNQSDLDAASTAWDLMFKYHGRPSGAFAADEMLAGLDAVRGTELCLVVEAMFSGSYLFQVTGDAKYADRVERMAYNALPATLTADMWGRQYLQQQNQIAAKNMTPNPFPEDGPDSNIFGLEPNYPCCTVNFPQGWPKFITNAFAVPADNAHEMDGLVQVYLGPFTVDTVLGSDNAIHVTVDTKYPFSDNIVITIEASKPFLYHVRIPSWVAGGSLRVERRKECDFSAETAEWKPLNVKGGLQAVPVPAGETKVFLRLPAEVVVEKRPHGSIAIHRGPLNYAFDIRRRETVLARDPHEPRAVDLQMEPVEGWEYAIDPDTLEFHSDGETQPLPSPIFSSGQPPVTLSVVACPIAWETDGDLFVAPPPQNPACVGQSRRITLTPFGATKLRISEFPIFRSNLQSLEGVNYHVQQPL